MNMLAFLCKVLPPASQEFFNMPKAEVVMEYVILLALVFPKHATNMVHQMPS